MGLLLLLPGLPYLIGYVSNQFPLIGLCGVEVINVAGKRMPFFQAVREGLIRPKVTTYDSASASEIAICYEDKCNDKYIRSGKAYWFTTLKPDLKLILRGYAGVKFCSLGDQL